MDTQRVCTTGPYKKQVPAKQSRIRRVRLSKG
jgi:hypothetical protein